MADFKESIAAVKLAYDLVDYVGQSGVQLKQAGAGKFKGLCPFHSEKTSSFNVDANFQNYRCFGCGAHGDLIGFVQAFEHLEFFDALKKLAEDRNIELAISEERSGVDYASLREAMRATANFFVMEYRKLPADHPAREEVRKRGLSERRMMYGYAPENRQALYTHLSKAGFSDETILLTGACQQFEGQSRITDFWHGRLMFFFTDVTGKVVGWSGRKLYETDTRGKYVNSREGVLFDKSTILFHLAEAKAKAAERRRIYVVEGQFDVAALVEADLPEVVAASGTAFTEKQGMALRRLVTDEGNIVFCFDGDAAGQAAALKVFQSVPALHGQAYAVTFPDGDDPDTYRRAHGNEGLRSHLNSSAVPLIEFVLSSALARFDLSVSMEKNQYLAYASRVLRTVTSGVLRNTYTRKVSLETFTSMEVLRQETMKAEPLQTARTMVNDDTEVQAEEIEAKPEISLAERMDEPVFMLGLRLVLLALQQVELRSKLVQCALLPPDFHILAKELEELNPQDRVIAERFSNSELVELALNSNLFPLQHLMNDEDYRQQFSYLQHRLERITSMHHRSKVRQKIAAVLQASPDQGAEFLERALAAEKRGLQHEPSGP